MGYAAKGNEKALLRLEAALDLALSGGEADPAWTKALAQRIADDPGLSRTSQKAPENLALKRLLND